MEKIRSRKPVLERCHSAYLYETQHFGVLLHVFLFLSYPPSPFRGAVGQFVVTFGSLCSQFPLPGTPGTVEFRSENVQSRCSAFLFGTDSKHEKPRMAVLLLLFPFLSVVLDQAVGAWGPLRQPMMAITAVIPLPECMITVANFPELDDFLAWQHRPEARFPNS